MTTAVQPRARLLARTLAAAVNHLLARQLWAREQLAPYTGKTARLFSPTPRFELTLVVESGGTVAALASSGRFKPDVTITLPGTALPLLLSSGQAGVMTQARIEGDAEYAATLRKLAEHLRWEPEEDLARLIGDAPAHRVTRLARRGVEQGRRAGNGLLGALIEYMLDEKPQLVRRRSLDAFALEVSAARDTLARLEKRLERVEWRRSHAEAPNQAGDSLSLSSTPGVLSSSNATMIAPPAPR